MSAAAAPAEEQKKKRRIITWKNELCSEYRSKKIAALIARFVLNVEANNIMARWNELRFIGELGSGAYAKVHEFADLDSNERVAFKLMRRDCYKRWLNDVDLQQIDSFEAKLALFLTQNLLPVWPHFCDTFAYAIVPTRFTIRGIFEHKEEYFTIATLMRIAESTLDIRLSTYTCSMITVNAALSTIVQTLLTIALLARLGITHHDLRIENVLLAGVDSRSSIKYVVDGHAPIVIKTHGVLAMVGDFGVATQQDFWQLEQQHGDPRARAGTNVAHFYSNDDDEHDLFKTRADIKLLLVKARIWDLHGLRFTKLTTNERDFVQFFTSLLAHLEGIRTTVADIECAKVAVRNLTNYLVAALELVLERCAQTSEEFVQLALDICDQQFVARHFGATDLFADESTGIETTFVLPDISACSLLRSKLLLQLSQRPTLTGICVCSDC